MKKQSVEISTKVPRTSLGGLTPEILKQMGIDISITKEDLLSVITQTLSDQADERVEEARTTLRGYVERIEELRVAYYNKALVRIGKKAKVKALAKMLSTHYALAYALQLVQRTGGFEVQLVPVFMEQNDSKESGGSLSEAALEVLFVPPTYKGRTKHERSTCGDNRNYAKWKYSIFLSEIVKKWVIPEELLVVKREFEKALDEAKQDKDTLKLDTKRAHTRVIKDLLVQTQHGAALLKILNSRTTTARVKGSLANIRQERKNAWEDKAFKRKYGTTHFDSGKEYVSCGIPRREKVKVSKDTSIINCGNCRLTRLFIATYARQQYSK